MLTPARRSPFEVMLTAAFGLYALAGLLFFDKVATSTLRAYPPPWGRVFLVAAALACAVTLVGVVRAHTAVGVLIERAGLVGVAGVSGAYATWAIGVTGARGLAFGLFLAALAGSAGWRAWQITRALGAARKA